MIMGLEGYVLTHAGCTIDFLSLTVVRHWGHSLFIYLHFKNVEEYPDDICSNIIVIFLNGTI